jgi:uncharacterized membrane protein YeiB
MQQRRIEGIDVARGLAMLGMVVVHYVWAGDDTGPAAALARAMEGRAMPLFMLLGGIGVVLVSRSSAHPDRGLVIRAVLLLVLGLVLDAVSERIAIVLQFYGLLFLLAPVVRRLPVRVLVGAAVVTTAVGAVTRQLAGWPPHSTSFDDLVAGWPGLRSLLFDGYYPFFPVFAFFALGMVLARLDLSDRRVAATLAGLGTAVGVGVLVAADALADRVGLDAELAVPDGTFRVERLVDASGHSSMPAWVISAAGTSVAVLGWSLLVADRFPALVRPLAVVGAMALSFYTFQAVATRFYPPPWETGLAREWATVAELYLGFLVAATLWRYRFRRGPLEALLRVGSTSRPGVSGSAPPPPRTPGAPARPRPSAGTPPR